MGSGPLTKARGTMVVLRELPGQRAVPYLPPEQMAALRDAAVREVVRHAAETVPFYREFFNSEGIAADEFRSAEDLARLPLVDRQLVQADPDRFRSDSQFGRDVVSFRTAGSTGTPVTVYRDRRALLANIAHVERERVVEAQICGQRYRYRAASFSRPGSNLLRVRSFYGRASFRPLRPRQYQLSIEESPERAVEPLNRIRPLVFRGYGSYIELLFRTVAARGLPLHLPRVVVYSGDGMSPEGRQLIEERFGIPVVSRYSAVEAFRIGFFCEERSGFHLHEDLCHVRVVDGDGRPLPPGKRGEVVVSDFVNRGMVLLNYRLGDLARLRERGCACGRSSLLLGDLEGRVAEIVELSDGTLVHPLFLEAIVKKHPQVLRFDIVQREPDRFELRLVTADAQAYERVVDTIVADLRGLLRQARVEVERCDELPPQLSGKFQAIRSLCGSGPVRLGR